MALVLARRLRLPCGRDVADGTSTSEKISAAAEKKASSLMAEAEKKAASLTKAAEGKAGGLTRQAEGLEKKAGK